MSWMDGALARVRLLFSRRALMTFGGVEKHKEALRDGRGTSWLRAARSI